MHAYYLPSDHDQRLQHDSERPIQVDPGHLCKLGILHWTIPSDTVDGYEAEISEQRGYQICNTLDMTKEGLGDQYESKVKAFFHKSRWVVLQQPSIMDHTEMAMLPPTQ